VTPDDFLAKPFEISEDRRRPTDNRDVESYFTLSHYLHN